MLIIRHWFKNGFWLVRGTLHVFLVPHSIHPWFAPDALGQALFFAMPMVLQDPWYAHLLRMQCTMYSVLAC